MHLTEELDAARAAELTQHLRDCKACLAEVGRQTALDARLRAIFAGEPLDTSRIEHSVRHQIALESRPQKRSWRWIFAAVPVAGLVIGFILVLLGYRVMRPVAAPPSFTAAGRDHHAEVIDQQPRRWRTDRASINDLAAKQGLPVSAIVAFSQDGFRLEQAKLCRLDNLTYVHLVYTSGTKRFSLFLRRPAEQDKGAPNHDSIDTANLGAEHLAAFHHGPLSAIIVTDEPGDARLRIWPVSPPPCWNGRSRMLKRQGVLQAKDLTSTCLVKLLTFRCGVGVFALRLRSMSEPTRGEDIQGLLTRVPMTRI